MHQRPDQAWQGFLPRCHMRSAVRWLFVLVLLGGVLLHNAGAAQPTRFEIGLLGCLPYSEEDEGKFPTLLPAMNEANLAFVVLQDWDDTVYR